MDAVVSPVRARGRECASAQPGRIAVNRRCCAGSRRTPRRRSGPGCVYLEHRAGRCRDRRKTCNCNAELVVQRQPPRPLWLAAIPGNDGAASMGRIHEQRARHRRSISCDHQQHRRQEHPRDHHAARTLLGKLGDVAERQQVEPPVSPSATAGWSRARSFARSPARSGCAARAPPA